MTTWSYGGVNLSTYGAVTLIDDDLDMPDRRGNNQVIPFNHGTQFVEKYFDERKMIFGLSTKAASRAALETLIDTLKSSIALQTLQTLSQTREDASVRTALASVDKNLQIKRDTGLFLKMIIEFTLPFPFFRLSTDIVDNTTTINANPKAMTVTNPGTVEERDATIILTGPLSNTIITNSTNGHVLTYTGTIASPRVVTLSKVSGQYVATDDLGANVIGNFSHVGSSALMVFNKGTNTLSIADNTHTTGTVKITFKAPFI